MSDLRRTWHLFSRYRGGGKVYVIAIVLLAIEAATAVFEAVPIAWLIDFINEDRAAFDFGFLSFIDSAWVETILILTVGIVALAAINSAADSLTEVFMARGGRSFGYRIRVAMYSHLQRLPLAYHDKKRTGDVLTRVTGDVLVAEEFIVVSVSNILGALMLLVGSFAFMLYTSWEIALIALFVVPLLAILSNFFSTRIKAASKAQRAREGELASTAQEMLTSIRLVQSYGRGTVDLHRFSEQTEKSMTASLWAANIQAQFSFVIALAEALAISAVVWLGYWLVTEKTITAGTLVLLVLLLQNMFKPSRKVVSEWYKLGKVFASVERIDDLLDRKVVVEDAPYAIDAPELQGRLTFKHVSFAYPAEHEDGSQADARPAVLNDIDFEAYPGEVVALVGFSGAGKSTIAQLVPRLYDPDEGAVLVDGLPLRSLTLASLRSQVSLVLQDTVLLAGSVAENIGYGVPNATQEDIERAARLANAHEFIMALPDGYDSNLGERGATLSGGQRQRLAIARAFIRQAPILILDEPTTGLDPESAQVVVSALRSLMQGKTTLLISHDLGLIRHADRALFIADGRIVESGSPERLLESGGLYADLHATDEAAGDALAIAPPAAPVRKRSRSTLSRALGQRLPGMEMALDEEVVSRRIEELLLEDGASVTGAKVGKLWVRSDGSCTMRYTVGLSDSSEFTNGSVVLGRLHASDDDAAAYMSRQLRKLRGLRRNAIVTAPWRADAARIEDAGLAMHPFPVDPELPTLARALEPDLWHRLPGSAPPREQSAVEVVHYPREGACVLRYHFNNLENGNSDAAGRTLYGKVYSDHAGRIVHRFLTGLAGQPTGSRAASTQFPYPVAYAPRQHLLVTEPLPGLPMIPDMLKATWAEPEAHRAAYHGVTLRAAIRSAGEALVTLHDAEVFPVPAHTASGELGSLRRDLDIVARDWPEVAADVEEALQRLAPVDLEQESMVLSHGDFTPSQVLLAAGRPAVVDLDTLCWADPALDLGRFMAQLELLGAKNGGYGAQQLVEELSEEFLFGYEMAAQDSSRAYVPSSDRIAFYRATTLARSALHSCRQLKDRRLEVATSLLESVTNQPSRR
jgi:ABC-type multidrug transport system fused ATPase/permease subunit